MLKINDTSAFVYVRKIQKLKDCYCYKCYTQLNNEQVPVSEIDDDKARRTLESLEIESLPLLTRIYAYNKHYLPGFFGMAVNIDIRETHNDSPSFAVAHYMNSVNQFKIAQKFCDAAIYIKKLDKYRLYYLGARYSEQYDKYHIIRLYIPEQQTTQKLRYHMNIIYQLQHTLSEKEYKDLKNTLNLHFDGDDISITFYHAFTDNLVTARFDFYNKRTNTCMNFSELADDPIGLILSLYYSTKAYKEGKEVNDFAESSQDTLR